MLIRLTRTLVIFTQSLLCFSLLVQAIGMYSVGFIYHEEYAGHEQNNHRGLKIEDRGWRFSIFDLDLRLALVLVVSFVNTFRTSAVDNIALNFISSPGIRVTDPES